MTRRTISVPGAVDDLVREVAEDGESYSAAVSRLIEAGARALKKGRRPAWLGMGRSGGPKDFARHHERYVREALEEL
ncbi:MAG: hypothetical protein ACRDF0_07900 [Candidatus Limnocylindria bacterium]